MELFALGKGLFAEVGERGDHGLNFAEGMIAGGGAHETIFQEAFKDALECFFGLLGFGDEVSQGFLVGVSSGFAPSSADAVAESEDGGVSEFDVEAERRRLRDNFRDTRGGIVIEKKEDGLLLLRSEVVELAAAGEIVVEIDAGLLRGGVEVFAQVGPRDGWGR